MRNKLLSFITLLLLSHLSYSCGGWESSYFDFHSLFIGQKYPSGYQTQSLGNIQEWKDFFKGKYDNEINNIVFSFSVNEVEKIKENETNELFVKAFEYLIYAKELGLTSKRLNGTIDPYSWDYDQIIREEVFDDKLLRKGLESFHKTENIELKMRYAYQVIRYYHYNKKWQEAVDFYQLNVPQLNLENELFYYCLDQVSGCYHSLGNYQASSYGFLQVVNSSVDRKLSASHSFYIESEEDFNMLLKKCKSPSERILARTLMTEYNYDYNDARWIFENEYNEEALMSIYYYHDIHEEYGYHSMMDNYDHDNEIDKNYDEELIIEIVNHPKTKNFDFWYHCLAYFAFQNGRFVDAKNYINSIKVNDIVSKEKYNFYKNSYNVLDGDELTNESENELYKIYINDVQSSGNIGMMEDLYFTMLRSYLLKDKSILKARLITSIKENIDQIYDIDELNDLQNLFLKKDKNDLEKFLLEKSLNGIDNVKAYLLEKKASYYLMMSDFEKASDLFDKLPKFFKASLPMNYSDQNVSYQFDGYNFVPKEIFSINIKEGFEFPMNQILSDTVILNVKFDFIKKEFTKAELNNYLIDLKDMAAKGNAEANYLLANYYYNTSELGYFRNILLYYPDNNLCSACRSNDILCDYWEQSNEYYATALSKATDHEFKAKITYLMAKNLAFSDRSDNEYYNVYNDASRTEGCLELFHELETTYSDSKFYDEIIEECSVFSYYVSR